MLPAPGRVQRVPLVVALVTNAAYLVVVHLDHGGVVANLLLELALLPTAIASKY